jgi:hypothetical protein
MLFAHPAKKGSVMMCNASCASTGDMKHVQGYERTTTNAINACSKTGCNA